MKIGNENSVNCWNPEMGISSQAWSGKVSHEGSETMRVSPNNNLSHECRASFGDDDIVRAHRNGNYEKFRIKNLNDNKTVRGWAIISPSLNTLNCWNSLKPISHNVAGNGKREGLKNYGMQQWPISSECPLKSGQRSSTKVSSLSLTDMAKTSRTGRMFSIRGHQDIVRTRAKAQEDRINNLSITFSEIKAFGDTVVIRTIPNVVIKDYYKGMKLTYDTYESAKVELQINKGKYWAFGVDSVDKRQSDLPFVDKWSDDAGQQMKIAIDTAILADIYADVASTNKGTTAGTSSGSYNLGTTTASIAITKANVIDYIVDCEAVLTENNLPESDRWLVIPTWMKNLLEKSDLKDASMTGRESTLPNGRIGMLAGFEIYVSNNYTAVTDTDQCYHVLFGHKSALTFAAQITESESLKNPDSFGDLIRGLNVYGYEVVKPTSMGDLYCHKG